MATTSDPEEIPRLYGALNERILAKDKDGTIQVYYELLRLGRPLSEIMARAEHVEDGPGPDAPGLAGEASAAGADAKILDAPAAPESARPERLAERASAIIAGRRGEASDWAIEPAAPGEALPITGYTANQLKSRRGATARPVARLGFAAGAILVAAGIGVLLLHPSAQKVAPGDTLANEAAADTPAGTTADAAGSEKATGETSTAEPIAAPAATVMATPPAERAPSLPPVPEAPQRDMATAAAPADPAPAARPAPEPQSRVAAPLPKTAPDRPRLAAAEIAALLARGDTLLGVGDITSARLFYERASDAGDGRAALRLGATYDPSFLDRIRLPHLNGDAAQALSWYRRARDLGESEAERWIQAIETKSGR